MTIKQAFRLAIKSLRSSKMRSFLTMLGIIIGVASVIVLVSLMNGLSSDMTSSFEKMGTNTLTVNITGRGGNRTFAVEDMEDLIAENPEHFSDYSPMVMANVTVKYGSDSETTTAQGVNESLQEIQKIELESGRFIQYIDTSRRQNICVIGTYQVNEYFGGGDALNQTLKINGSNYTVVGVVASTDDSSQGSADDVIYIPYTTAARMSFSGTINTYYVAATDTDNIETAVAVLEKRLYQVFADEDAYSVTSMTSIINTINELTGTVSMVLVGIAGISLLVGGIGIMNIMLVSVTERTREIGVRKSLGAKKRDIMQQFMIEAGTTSSTGGLIGIITGILMAYGAGYIMDMSVVISLGAVFVAFSVSAGIGIIFGYFPANKAAKMNPIDALRHD